MARTIKLESTAADGTQDNEGATVVAISSDGTEIAFVTVSTNLGFDIVGNVAQIFVKNITTGAINLVSTASDNTTQSNIVPSDLSLSSNGGKLAFDTTATNLGFATGGTSEVYVKDLATGTLRLASTAADNSTIANGQSMYPSLSADGSEVTFASFANNLGFATNTSEIYVKNIATGALQIASSASNNTTIANDLSSRPSISANGRYVAFESIASNLGYNTHGAYEIYVKDLVTGTLRLASVAADNTTSPNSPTGCVNSVISGNGNRVAFEGGAASGAGEIYVKDLTTGALYIASTAADNTTIANGASQYASLSADGRYVEFTSTATNLIAGVSGQQVYLKDLLTGGILLLSENDAGVPGNHESNPYNSAFRTTLSGNAQVAAFYSNATNFVTNDANGSAPDVFVSSIVPPTITGVVTSGPGITNGTGDLSTGQIVTFTASTSEALTVDTAGGTPTLTLNDGGTAIYTGGSGTSTLAFSYTVAAGQNTADLTVIGTALNGATIRDGDGNNANLSGAVTNPPGTLQIDTSAYVDTGNTGYFGTSTPNYTTYKSIYMLEGNDTASGFYAGDMTIEGGNGNDSLFFGSTVVTGGAIFGGAGADYINAQGMSSTSTDGVYLDGGTGNDTLIGGGLNDTIVGNGADSMVGSTVTGAMNQFFDVSNGSTTMIGGAAATNRFHASGGNDRITAGNVGDFAWLTHFGSDTFVGGTGNDTVSSQNSGSNSISTGGGNDLIYSASAHDVISTGDGANTVYAVSADQLLVYGGAGNDVIFVGGTYTATGSGSSTVYNAIQVTGGGGNDTIDGTGGRGVLYIAPGTGSGVNVVNGDDVGNHIYGQFNTGQLFMRGGRGGDEMVGGQGGNTFIGAGGGDFVRAAGVANVFDFNSIGEGGLHIANFNASTDRFAIYAGGFGSQLYGGETLTAGYNLINGSTATQQTGTFLYHDALLFFDPDGTGAIAPTALAGFTAGTNAIPTALSANNFTISGTKL